MYIYVIIIYYISGCIHIHVYELHRVSFDFVNAVCCYFAEEMNNVWIVRAKKNLKKQRKLKTPGSLLM
jgi:hypothetical protein